MDCSNILHLIKSRLDIFSFGFYKVYFFMICCLLCQKCPVRFPTDHQALVYTVIYMVLYNVKAISYIKYAKFTGM